MTNIKCTKGQKKRVVQGQDGLSRINYLYQVKLFLCILHWFLPVSLLSILIVWFKMYYIFFSLASFPIKTQYLWELNHSHKMGIDLIWFKLMGNAKTQFVNLDFQ